MNKNKKWCMLLGSFTVLTLMLAATIVIIIDPYMHYHKPLDCLEYPMNSGDQRYINDGIIRQFEYDALIIGSSMTENFKTSQLNDLFGVNAIKVCNAGDTYYNIKTNIEKAIEEQGDIKLVVTSLDINRLCDDPNHLRTDMGEYPTYLYDDYLYNDVEYVLNKDVLLEKVYKVIKYTREGNKTTTFDEYCNWQNNSVFGKEAVLATYDRLEKMPPNMEAQEQQQANIAPNVLQNIVKLAQENPNTEFYLFFPPYSIYYWDNIDRYSVVEWQIDNMKIATELLLECENIHIYSFFDEYEIISDLSNYKDMVHYSETYNEYILDWIAVGEHELTKENYEHYYEEMKNYYCNYDYDSLFEE